MHMTVCGAHTTVKSESRRECLLREKEGIICFKPVYTLIFAFVFTFVSTWGDEGKD